MKLRKLVLAATVMVGLSNMAGAAFAQVKTFYIVEERARAQTKVGREMNGILNATANKGVDELGLATLKKQVDDEENALIPQLQSLSKEAVQSNPALKARVDALNQKNADLEQKSQQVQAVVNRQSSALNTMFTIVLDQAIAYAAKQAGAEVVLSDPGVRYLKETVDLTPKVIARLDATIPTVAALQAAMPQPAQPAQGAAKPAAAPAGVAPAAPAAPATAPKPQ